MKKLQRCINKNLGRPIRRLAADLKVDESTIRRYLKEHICYRSHKMCKRQFMTEETKARRIEKAKRLLNEVKNMGKKDRQSTTLIFFSNEKNFKQDQKVNWQNNRWFFEDPKEVIIVMLTKFPALVMVLGVVSNKGHMKPPYFFQKGLSLNAAIYIDVMVDMVKPWMDRVAEGWPYMFQQDGVPVNNAKVT